MSDCELVFTYLQDHPGWHNAVDLMRELKPGAVNWALRSRVSELNQQFKFNGEEPPFHIESRIGKNGCAEYKLNALCIVRKFDKNGQGEMGLAI